MDEDQTDMTGRPPADGRASADEVTPAMTLEPSAQRGGGPRVFAAAVTLPWLMLYGITGAWALTRGAMAYADGLERLDVGYTRFVTPGGLMYFGALLLTAFGVMLACALLLVFRRRSAMVWLPLFLVSAGLTAGSVWAAVSGGLHPLLWVVLFFGLAYVALVALVRVLQMTRAARRARIARS